MTQANKMTLIGLIFTIIVYGVQDIKRQTSYETRLDNIITWQQEQQKTEKLTQATNQKVDALAVTVDKMADNMNRFLEELYKMKGGLDERSKQCERTSSARAVQVPGG